MPLHIDKNPLFVLFLILTPFLSISQTSYKEGTVVTATGDTLRGFIDFSGWQRNPDKIFFKVKQENSEMQAFTPADTRSFSINGFESYSKFTVAISMDEVRYESLKESIDTTSVTKAVFLKDLLKGDRMDLYSYKDEMKERFYILDRRQSVPSELLFRKTFKDMQENTQALFKQQLLKAALEFGVITTNLDHLIQTANYSISDVRSIISRINSQNNIAVSSASTGKKRKSTFFAGIGINYGRITHSGNSWVTVDGITEEGANKYKSSVVTQGIFPRFSAGIDFYINPASRRFIIRTELAATNLKSTVVSNYRYNNFSAAGIEYTYKFSSLNISFNPQLIYNFYNTINLKSYFGVGASISYLRANENSLHGRYINQTSTATTTEENFLALKETSMSGIVRLGAQINQRIDLSVLWGNPLNYTSYGGGNSASIKSGLLAFSAAFLFRK